MGIVLCFLASVPINVEVVILDADSGTLTVARHPLVLRVGRDSMRRRNRNLARGLVHVSSLDSVAQATVAVRTMSYIRRLPGQPLIKYLYQLQLHLTAKVIELGTPESSDKTLRRCSDPCVACPLLSLFSEVTPTVAPGMATEPGCEPGDATQQPQ